MIAELIILILAIPSGYLIAWLARDELIQGRKWFHALIILSVIVGIIFYLLKISYIAWASVFIIIICLISLIKRKDKKWTKKKLK